ncbi:MAG TPA: APC family permease, partial [Candidatus Thermoplasmatota archaeon]|nr:APC family permease [Candidatus Thermoplasmatota archaeon]
TAIYVLVSLAAVALLDPQELAQSESPLADAVRGPAPWLVGALGGVALFATANTALISIMVASRMLFGMARDGDAPRPLARTLERRATPVPALVAVLAGALALLAVGGLGVVASVASVMALVAFGSVNLALVRLRFVAPDAERPLRVPWSVGRVPVLPVLGVLAVAAVLTQFDLRVYLIAAAVALAALAAQALARRAARRRE